MEKKIRNNIIAISDYAVKSNPNRDIDEVFLSKTYKRRCALILKILGSEEIISLQLCANIKGKIYMINFIENKSKYLCQKFPRKRRSKTLANI